MPQLASHLERFAVGQRRSVQLIERGSRGEGQGKHRSVDLCAEEQRLAALRRDGITDMHRFLRRLSGDQQRPQRFEDQERIGIPDAGFQRLPLSERQRKAHFAGAGRFGRCAGEIRQRHARGAFGQHVAPE